MHTSPVFLFAFANDTSQSLHLDEEWRQTEKALETAEDAGKLRFRLVPATTQADLWAKFNRFRNQIALFHYGGHSSEQGINLTDTEVEGPNLATLIGLEQQLKLVFLNGCSNANQVRTLFDQGVPLVVATTGPVVDRRAIDLSRQFYEALAAGRTIEDAFSVAAAYVNNRTETDAIAHRGLALEASPQLQWGLYVNKPTALKWTIPDLAATGNLSTDSKPITQQNAEKIYNIDQIDRADFS